MSLQVSRKILNCNDRSVGTCGFSIGAALLPLLRPVKTLLTVFRFVPLLLALTLALLSLLAGCTFTDVRAQEGSVVTPEERIVAAVEKRIFLDISLEFLDEYEFPSNRTFEETPIGGLSAIAYDRGRDRFYALSDDASAFSPARFYTLRLVIDSENPGVIKIQNLQVESVTSLKGEDGQTYPRNSINLEGIAFAPPNSVFIASEGVASYGVPPFVNEYDLGTGQWVRSLPIPQRYLPDTAGSEPKQGVQNNLGFESLTLSLEGVGAPFRLFTATESPLLQDREPPSEEQQQAKNRLLHYLVSDEDSTLISEHLYSLEIGPKWSLTNGLTDLLAIGQGGHFLSLERSLGFLGYGARIFQVATGGATDTAGVVSFKGELKGIEPVKKKLLLDLADLGITLDNLEGMAIGPRLPDGTQSLAIVSDNDFDKERSTQFLLFRLKIGR